ncbi:MAG: M1 family metallopeptidase [Melioribacter sp.]|uniref:M1 family metallopeptidase n=1 Tax=Melioribacter sp. TaxID=2052167 RepID=UPI003BE2D915
MKIRYIILSVLFIGVIIQYSEEKTISNFYYKFKNSGYEKGLIKSEANTFNPAANYNFFINYDPINDIADVREEIRWINNTEFPTEEIYLHLYPNAYSNNNTFFAQAYRLEEENMTRVNIEYVDAEGERKDLIYVNPEIVNPYDSTVAKFILRKKANPGDTVKIDIKYSLKIPVSVKRFGTARGRNFDFISQWYPKIGVFEDGKWICSSYYPYLNYYSDFGEYRLTIKIPKNFTLIPGGEITDVQEEGAVKTYTVVQSGIHDFVWAVTDNIVYEKTHYKRKDGATVNVNLFIQPERIKYRERYKKAVVNCLAYFEEKVGIYPYSNLTMVDVPRTSASGGMEYPTLFTVSAELFSPEKTGWPEYLVAHEFAHQYFQGIIANNEVYEAWLDEGFASYFATKFMYEFYPDILAYFRIAKFVPVFGLNFLSYNEIPIIYTIADIPVNLGAQSAASYYRNLAIGSISDLSYLQPSRLAYVVNSYSKPELMLHTLERYLGSDKMDRIVKEYYNAFKFRHVKANDFINLVKRFAGEDIDWFFKEFYADSKIFDYSITSVNKAGNNLYAVTAERKGDGFFKNDIALYTETDTLYAKWEDDARWKIFYFETEDKVYGAEIDPHRKNLLDIDFANNSYMIEKRYWASLSISARWFFWVQNALIILGSIG